jgi:hypothetical protein
MRHFFLSLLALTFVAMAYGQDNPFKRCAIGDWAKYVVSSKNETVPLMSVKDQPRWRVISNASDEWVRCDNYLVFGGQRRSGGGTIYNFKDRYEPVPGIAQSAQLKIVSSAKEKVTVNGKQYDCTKIVRKIDQPLDEAKLITSWIGTSTLWLCDQVPLGLVKMENVYETQLTKSDKANKITETWVLAESGFKNWKEE